MYAPTLDAEEELKDAFYDVLQDAADRFPTGDMINVAGGWQNRPGLVDITIRCTLGKLVLGPRCFSGGRLANFASANCLVVSSARFQHPWSHLVIWFSNDGHTRSQVLVWSRWAHSVTDCRAYNEVKTGSKHCADQVIVRVRMKAARPSNLSAKFDTAKLKSTALGNLRLELRNRFEGLVLNGGTFPENEWWKHKHANAEASQTYLGRTRRRHRGCATDGTIALAEHARLVQRLLEGY